MISLNLSFDLPVFAGIQNRIRDQALERARWRAGSERRIGARAAQAELSADLAEFPTLERALRFVPKKRCCLCRWKKYHLAMPITVQAKVN